MKMKLAIAIFALACLLSPGSLFAFDDCYRGYEESTSQSGTTCGVWQALHYKQTQDPSGCYGTLCSCTCSGTWSCRTDYYYEEYANCTGECCEPRSEGCGCP